MESYASVPVHTVNDNGHIVKVYVPVDFANMFERKEHNWQWDKSAGDLVCTKTHTTFFHHAGLTPEYVSNAIVVYSDTIHPLTNVRSDLVAMAAVAK